VLFGQADYEWKVNIHLPKPTKETELQKQDINSCKYTFFQASLATVIALPISISITLASGSLYMILFNFQAMLFFSTLESIDPL